MPALDRTLPAVFGRFFGRAGELSALEARLRDSKLVTVAGAPGIGKTRLALEYASRLEEGGTRILFFDLSLSTSEESVALAVLGGKTVDVLSDELRRTCESNSTLLIFDTCDHVIGAITRVIQLMRREAPQAQLLVTSRARLNAPGESVLELVPLPSVDHGEQRSDALALLLERCDRAGRAPSTEEEVLQATALVKALDGIPLALELAAPRVAILGARNVLEQLRTNLDVLDGARRDAPDRHGSWRAAMDWSWNLLTGVEQTFFAQVSIFRGFTMEAAVAVVVLGGEGADAATAPDEQRRATTVHDIVRILREKSLVVGRDAPGGASRFELLASLELYARQRLAGFGLTRELEARHRAYYADVVQTWSEQVVGTQAPMFIDRVLAETENVTALVERALATQPRQVESVNDALGALTALVPLGWMRGAIAPLSELLDRLILAAEETPVDERRLAAALSALGGSFVRLGRTEGEPLQRRALEIAGRQDDARLTGRIQSSLALTLFGQSRAVEAVEMARGAVLLHELAGDLRYEGETLTHLGRALKDLGKCDLAIETLERALEIHRRVRNPRLESMSLSALSSAYVERGDLDGAERAIAGLPGGTDPYQQVLSQPARAALAHARGPLPAALHEYEVSQELARKFGYRTWEGVSLGYAAIVLIESGDVPSARDALLRSCAVLAETREPRYRALFTAYLGALDAMAGSIAVAESRIGAGLAQLPSDDPFRVPIELQRVHVLLANGDASGAEKAEALVRDVAGERTGGRESPVRRRLPFDARIALRIVESALVARGVEVIVDRTDLRAQAPAGLRVEEHGRWFEVQGSGRVDCARWRAAHRMLATLVEARVRTPGASVSLEALKNVAWPGERLQREAVRNRIKVAISLLRRLGLRALIVRRKDGYVLDPQTAVEVVRGPSGATSP